jgi:hypothetical protein
MTSRSDELDWFLCGMVSKPLFSSLASNIVFSGTAWIDPFGDEVHIAINTLFNEKES